MQKRIFACKYVWNKDDLKDRLCSKYSWIKQLLLLTYERKRNAGTQLKLILVFNM